MNAPTDLTRSAVEQASAAKPAVDADTDTGTQLTRVWPFATAGDTPIEAAPEQRIGAKP